MIEFTIQLVGTRVDLLLEVLMSFPCLLAAFARTDPPSFYVGQSFFQGSSPLGHLRVLDRGLGKPVIGVNGVITNDKFCVSRITHLRLGYCRLPEDRKQLLAALSGYP